MPRCSEKNKSMSKKISVFLPLFTVSFLPVLTMLLYPFGYSVSIFSYEILSAVSAVICILSGHFIKTEKSEKRIRILFAFLPLIQFINTITYVTESKSALTAVFMAISFISCAVISKNIISSDKAKITSVITSSLMFLVIILISFVTVFFGNFSVNTVVDTIDSPNGEYYAEVVDSDQGALGGNTVVYIKKTDRINLLIAVIEKSPERVYVGDWREYETMNIDWKDDDTLTINSDEYTVK